MARCRRPTEAASRQGGVRTPAFDEAHGPIPIGPELKRADGGRSTQLWDATVRDEHSGKIIALFRCTQILLHAQAG